MKRCGNSLLYVMCACLLAGASAVAECATPAFPGGYGFSLKWKDTTGEVRVRTGIYSFRRDNTFRADYWEWGSHDDGTNSLVPADTIGSSDGIVDVDKDKQIITQRKFLEEDFKREWGRWDSFSNNTLVRIRWRNGAEEWWKVTWHDETLYKLEAYFLNTAANWRDFYLQNPAEPPSRPYSRYFFQRNKDAENTGFALGNRESFDNNAQPISAFEGIYRGMVFRKNYYSEATDTNQVKGWKIRLGTDHPDSHQLTDRRVWRYTVWGSEQKHWVYDYLDQPNYGSFGLKSRRVHMQVDHDSDNDFHISDESGHVYLGFQIIDSNNDVRGFVFSEASYDPDKDAYMMLSAMYLLDELGEEAHTGFEIDPNLHE